MVLSSRLLALSAVAGLAAAAPRQQLRCGSESPAQHVLDAAAKLQENDLLGSVDTDTPLSIPVNFHVVAASDKKMATYTDAKMAEQFDVLKNSYAPYNVNFEFNTTTRLVDWDISTGLIDSKGQRTHKQEQDLEDFQRATRLGDYKSLNLYIYTDFPSTLFGLCEFPTTVKPDSYAFWTDGCHINSETMPGGKLTGYNEGKTIVHETGHWLGLFHVFQGHTCGLSDPGDYIDDTPPQTTATSGCPADKDSCPSTEGMDSIHNYMDYSSDSCYESFTPGQQARIFSSFQKYRASQ